TWSSSGRSAGAVGAVGWLVGGPAWPPDSLPPATAQLPPAPPRRASASHQPRMVGLLVPFADALGGQGLAQPGMLVVHGSHPFPQLSRIDCWLAQDGPGACRPNLAPAIRTAMACSQSLAAGPPPVAISLWP